MGSIGIRDFFSFVEIRTKVASVIPCLLGTVYALYHFQRFDVINFLLFVGSLVFIDMFTTAWNNYMDPGRHRKKYGAAALALVLLLFAAAVTLGLLLVMRTSLVVLALGALSFLVGIVYSFGPVPLSGTVLGEAFSGFFMGFVIVYLSVYIHVHDTSLAYLSLEGFSLTLGVDLLNSAAIFLLSVPTMCGIANIMLANNICDMEEDIKNRRVTLPEYIGKGNALLLFKLIYAAAYAGILALCVLGLIPLLCVLTLATAIPVYKNVKAFMAVQTKSGTFSLAVKNFSYMCFSLLLLFFAAWLVSLL